jgi:acyl-coenzyme A thioesterase PaaI-like protein
LTSEARTAEVIGDLPFEIAPHRCFACGSLNRDGLGLVIHVEAQRAWIETRLDPRFQGWDGIAHGGIVATILDEVMAWSLAAEDTWGVTARMAIHFRRPVPLDSPIRADGWIVRSRRRLQDTAARLVDVTTGVELATATGLYVSADEARKAELRERYAVRPAGTAT